MNLDSMIGNLKALERIADEASRRIGRFGNDLVPLIDQFKKSEAP
jgi:hypothetical protein